MAKRIQFSAHGGPEVLEYVDYTPAEPGPQQVRVRNQAIGLNFIDTYFRSGLYAPPALPSAWAPKVPAWSTRWAAKSPNSRSATAWPTARPAGSYSELHVLPAANLVHLPDEISFEQAAGAMLKGLTVQYLLRQTYELKGGETILFHAAAGGVGSLACQWAKALGVKLIGTVSSPEKAAQAKSLGAWETIDYSKKTSHNACWN
jgi:NADPH2:quinone reductase